MAALAREFVDLFHGVYPSICTDWAEMVLYWAMNSQINHLSCRSLQLFRSLTVAVIDGKTFYTLAKCLKDSFSSSSNDTRAISLEIIACFKNIAQHTRPEEFLKNHTSLFWIAFCLLSSAHLVEFYDGVSILTTLLKKVDLEDPTTTKYLIATCPKDWVDEFDGLLQPLCRGLCSSSTESPVLEVIDFLVPISRMPLLSPDPTGYLFVVLAKLPGILRSSYGFADETENLLHTERDLKLPELFSAVKSSSNCESLIRLLHQCVDRRIVRPLDFVKTLVSIVKEEFPQYEWKAIRLFVLFLSNPKLYYLKTALIALEYFVQDLPPIDPEDLEYDDNWLLPLIGVLDGPYNAQAAKVLDLVLIQKIKASSADLGNLIGGAQNLYSFAKRAKKVATPIYSKCGWLLDGVNQEGSNLARQRMSCILDDLKVKLNAPNNVPGKSGKIGLPQYQRNELMRKFQQLELHFRAKK